MYSVYQPWDPLRVCVVGRSYPPEFYSWITVPHVRSLFEQIAIETEEDYQNIIKKLESFGVEVLRPDLPVNTIKNGKHVPPPMCPRDFCVMVGETFYENFQYKFDSFQEGYNNIKDAKWPSISSFDGYNQLPQWIRQECEQTHNLGINQHNHIKILDQVRVQGNKIISGLNHNINGAMVSRIGKDLYFGTSTYIDDPSKILSLMNQEFSDYRNHVINTGGHADGTYCPVCPGLIISLYDIPTYADTFPGWEVVYLPGQSWNAVKPFLDLKNKNNGKWWIPGFEHDQSVIDTVETWLSHWTGYVEETVFDVNMLIIDPKNIMVFNYNKQVFDALDRYGITPHIVNFRHRYFWDGGIHCVTSDLHRKGVRQDFFPQRG